MLFRSEDYGEYPSDGENTICLDSTSDHRFVRVGGSSVKTEFGEVYNGLDRDTGNEVMWRVIKANNINQG